MGLNLLNKRVLFNYGADENNYELGSLFVRQKHKNGRIDLYIEDKHIAGGYGFNNEEDANGLVLAIKFPIKIQSSELENEDFDPSQLYYYDEGYTLYYNSNGNLIKALELELSIQRTEVFSKIFIGNDGIYVYNDREKKLTSISNSYLDMEIILNSIQTKIELALVEYVTKEEFEQKLEEMTPYFKSNSSDDLINTESVGGISKQQFTIEELKQMTISEILLKMLFKDYFPSISVPSINTNSIIYVALGGAFPNLSYSYNKGSVTIEGRLAYGSFGNIKEALWTGEKEDFVTRVSSPYIQTLSVEIGEGTELYYLNGGEKTQVIKGDLNGSYDKYLNENSKLSYTIQPILVNVLGFYPIFWYSYNNASFSTQTWFSDKSSSSTHEQVIYCDATHYKARPLFACESSKTPKFYIYNETKGAYNLDEGGLWSKYGNVYYEHNTQNVSSSQPTGSYTVYTQWRRSSEIDNTINYKIKVIL